MRYCSTQHQSPPVDLKTAVLQGLAPDQGLYLPERWPQMPAEFWRECQTLSFPEISWRLSSAILGEDIPEADLSGIVSRAFTFDAPLHPVADNTYVLELFHGPTLAFKDFAAAFMAQLMGYYMQGSDRELTILVATSGDTGSAVAHGFFQVPGIRVVLLYPAGRVSRVQEQQLSTMGENIRALEIAGSFDDCQRLVKAAFVDADLRLALRLSSANSINIARLIPQSFYYVRAYAQLPADTPAPLFSVPSGNFGNLCAGVIAARLGLPVKRFIAATNINRVLPAYLANGVYRPQPSAATISNAMDVGDPSNFVRLSELFSHSHRAMAEAIWGRSFSDAATRQAIKEVYQSHSYILDPHGAVGWLALQAYQSAQPTKAPGIFFETAHPAKFGEVVEECLGQAVALPERLRACLDRPKQTIALPADFAPFKELLLSLTT